MKDEWRRLIGYSHWDSDSDGNLSNEELQSGVDEVCAAHSTAIASPVRSRLRIVCALHP